MLNETLLRAPRTDGRQQLLQRGTHGAQELSVDALASSPAGATDDYTASGEETDRRPAGRTRHVHDEPGAMARESRRRVRRARHGRVRAARRDAPRVRHDAARSGTGFRRDRPRGGEPAVIGPDAVRVNPRGKGSYAREVHDLFVTDPHARRLMVGETFNPPGHWSSYPPHKHDGRDGEPKLEEVYHYRIDPPQGFGHQMLYTADGESVTHTVRDGDAVLLPYGYHPVSAPPGYRLYYLWAIAGAQRKLALHEDPAHTWIHQQA